MLLPSVIRTVLFFLIVLLPESGFSKLVFELGTTDDDFRYIIVSGDFEYEDGFAEFNRIVRLHEPHAVTFDSNGGNVYKAMELGRLIRASNLGTLQPRGNECVSACSLAFMGGVHRYAEPGAIGVHKSSFSRGHDIDVDSAVSEIQELTADIIQYMIEMGVDPALLQLALKYDSDDVRYVSKREMEEFKLTTVELSPSKQAGVNSRPGSATPAPQSALPRPRTEVQIPVARSGLVRHPKNSAFLKSGPSAKSANLGSLANGTPVRIIRNADRWYFVSVASRTGFMHHSWVRVDQFDHTPGLLRHIQIKSFDNYDDALFYARTSRIPLSVYLATNGWFAVTIDKPLDRSVALNVNAQLKKEGVIPDDSFVTFGNTYMLRACCN